jgi:hypothetical protein
LLLSHFAFAGDAGVGRKPANFVPDEDMIIVPIYIEKNFIDEINEDNKREIQGLRTRVETWILNDEYARNYGQEDRGIVNTPSPERRQAFFERTYLRFITKRVERDTNEEVQDWWEENNAQDDEIESIDRQNARDTGYVIKAQKNKEESLGTKKKVKVGKDEFKFEAQPRLELGAVKFTMDSPYVDVTYWLGVNDNSEINLTRNFKSTNTRMMLNYYFEQARMLGIIDQKITRGVSARFTYDKYNNTQEFAGAHPERSTLQLRYSLRF